MQWAGVLYSDQNQITQNQKTKLRLESTSGVIPPQVQDFSFAFVNVHSMLNLDLVSTPGCTTCDQPAAQFLAGSNSSSGFQPTFIQSVPYLFVMKMDKQVRTPHLGKVRTQHKLLSPHLPTLWVTQCDSPHTFQCWCLKIILPFVCLEMVSRRILFITFLGIVVRSILIGSSWFWPLLTGCNWIKWIKNQFQPVPSGSNQFKPILNWLELPRTGQNKSEQV